ncbi:MAG: XdhC family protein [bacterium]
MSGELYEIALENEAEGTPYALVTVIDTAASSPRNTGAKMIVYEDGEIEGTIGGGALEANVMEEAVEALEEGQSRKLEYTLEPEDLGMYCGGAVELFIDVYTRDFHLVQFGGGHVGEAVARVAELTGRSYTIVDDREKFANRDKYPGASRVLCTDFEGCFEDLNVDENTYLSIITRGHSADGVVLKQALQTDACYIGMIGSESKIRRLCGEIEEEIGENPLDEDRVYAPIGLKLGTSRPGDIAVSLWSEILKLHTGGNAEHMRIQSG